jgi:hypothetical protein
MGSHGGAGVGLESCADNFVQYGGNDNGVDSGLSGSCSVDWSAAIP